MVSQGQLYDLLEEHQDKLGVGEAAYLTAQNFDRNKIATHLELRYRTSDPLEIFAEELLNVTGGSDIDWERNRTRIEFDQNERQYIDSLEVENTDQTIDEVLIEAYKDLYREHYTEVVKQALQSENLTDPAKVIAMIALRWHHQKETNIINEPFLWKVYNLIDQYDFQQNTRSDIINELIRAGCVASSNSNIYILPGLTELSEPERFLPQIKIVEPETKP